MGAVRLVVRGVVVWWRALGGRVASGAGRSYRAGSAFLEAYKAAEGMSTTERPLPQSEPHMQAMIDAGILNPRPQGKGRPT